MRVSKGEESFHELTDPIERKNEKVAALLSMYCDSVARRPRGPAPCLVEEVRVNIALRTAKAYRKMLHDPKMKPMVRPTPPPMRAPILVKVNSRAENIKGKVHYFTVERRQRRSGPPETRRKSFK